MYITTINKKVIYLLSELDELNDKSKLKFLIYVFNLINNNQINDKNESNPNLVDEELKILRFSSIGLNDNHCDIFVQYFISIYKIINKVNKIIYINGNVEGLNYNNDEKTIISNFERLSFNDKLDVLREIFIKYDNETYFKNKITNITFDSKLNGFDIANNILKFKEED